MHMYIYMCVCVYIYTCVCVCVCVCVHTLAVLRLDTAEVCQELSPWRGGGAAPAARRHRVRGHLLGFAVGPLARSLRLETC